MRNPCCDKGKDGNYNKGAWSKEEDEKLIDYIRTHGKGCWRTLPQAAGLRRCGKSCRLRWINYLRPDLKRGNFAEDEEDLIIKLHALLGNRWSLIAGRLPGRSVNEVKNYWNSHLRRKLIKMGIDPNNHRVRLIRNNYNLHRLQNPNNDASDHDSSTATSACREESYEALKSQLGDNATAFLPDLNLDLVMNNPISPSIAAAEEENHKSYHIKRFGLIIVLHFQHFFLFR